MKFHLSFLHVCKISILFFCLRFETAQATDNLFRYLEDKNFRIDRLETYNLYKTLGVGIHDSLGSFKQGDDTRFEIEFHTIMYMVRDEHNNLYFAIFQNQPLSLFNLWMQNLLESVGIHTIPTYPAFMNFNQKENLDIVPKEIREKIEDALAESGSEDIPIYEPILIVHAPGFFVGKESPGYFEYFGDSIRGVFSPMKSPNFSVEVQKTVESSSFSSQMVLDALSFLTLEYLLTVEGESRAVMENQFVGVTINTFFRSVDIVDNRKLLIKKLRNYFDNFVKSSEMSSSEAAVIYERLLARVKFFKEIVPNSLATNLRVFSGIAITNANYAQVMSLARRIQKNVETRLNTIEADLHYIFQQKMGRTFGAIDFVGIEKRATLSERIRNFTGDGELHLSSNYQENLDKLKPLTRRGFEKKILWDLYRSPELNTPSNQRLWERQLGLEPFSLIPTLLEESSKLDSTYRIRGALYVDGFGDISRPVPQLSIPKEAPPSLLVLPMNDSEMEVIYRSAIEIAKHADLEIMRLHDVKRPFEISQRVVKAISQKYPGRRIILCEVKNAHDDVVVNSFSSVGSELVSLDHHNQDFSNWDWRSTSEQFWDLYAYRPNAEEMLTAIIDRSGLRGMARNLDILEPSRLKNVLTKLGNSKVSSDIRKLPFYKIELDRSGFFYLVEDNKSNLRMRDIGDYLGLKHFPDYFQFVIYRGKHLSYTGDPVVISHFIETMYPLAKKYERPMYWYGDLNHGLTVVYYFNSYDTVDKIVTLIRELNQKRSEGNLLLSTFTFPSTKKKKECGETFD